MTSYEKIKNLQNENELIFNMAINWLIDIGVRQAKNITEEDIEKAHIPMFSDDYAKLLYRMTKELADIEEEDTLSVYKFIQIEKPFNTTGFKPRKKK